MDLITKTKNSFAISFAALIMLTPLSAAYADNSKVLEFGVVPQQSAAKLARTWGPILAHVESETGIKLRFSTAPSIPEFERRTAAGEYDIAYMNPYHYTVFHESPGYEAFAKARGKMIKGIVVVRKDSTMSNLDDLAEQQLAFPAPAAFAASVLPRAKFSTENINIEPKYVSSHDSVYLSVARGLYPAGGGIVRTLNTVDPAIRDQLKILWTTKPYTSHALAALPTIDPDTLQKVQTALFELEESEQGRELLKNLNWKGVEAAGDERWDDVRGLGIELLQMLINDV